MSMNRFGISRVLKSSLLSMAGAGPVKVSMESSCLSRRFQLLSNCSVVPPTSRGVALICALAAARLERNNPMMDKHGVRARSQEEKFSTCFWDDLWATPARMYAFLVTRKRRPVQEQVEFDFQSF